MPKKPRKNAALKKLILANPRFKELRRIWGRIETDEKKRRIRELLAELPKSSKRTLAECLGVDRKLIWQYSLSPPEAITSVAARPTTKDVLATSADKSDTPNFASGGSRPHQTILSDYPAKKSAPPAHSHPNAPQFASSPNTAQHLPEQARPAAVPIVTKQDNQPGVAGCQNPQCAQNCAAPAEGEPEKLDEQGKSADLLKEPRRKTWEDIPPYHPDNPSDSPYKKYERRKQNVEKYMPLMSDEHAKEMRELLQRVEPPEPGPGEAPITYQTPDGKPKPRQLPWTLDDLKPPYHPDKLKSAGGDK